MKELFALLTVCLLAFSNISHADGKSNYVGVGFGNSSLDISDPGADQLDDEDSYFKILGGSALTENSYIEFGYVDLGEYRAHYPLFDETDVAEGSALFASGIGSIPISEKISLFGKVGLNYWTVDASIDAVVLGTPVSGSGDGTGVSILFGGGAVFALNPDIAIRVELEKYNDVADGVDVSVPGVGSVELDGEDVDLFGATLIIAI